MLDFKALQSELEKLTLEQKVFGKLAKTDKDAESLLALSVKRSQEIQAELATHQKELKLALFHEKVSGEASALVKRYAKETGIDFAFRFGVRVLSDGETECFARVSLLERASGKLTYNGKAFPAAFSVNWGENGNKQVVSYSLKGSLKTGLVVSTYQVAFETVGKLYQDAKGKTLFAEWEAKEKYHKESARERLSRMGKEWETLDGYFSRVETADQSAARILDTGE
jgi:hypothetical protein